MPPGPGPFRRRGRSTSTSSGARWKTPEGGNLLADAHLAALAIDYQCELCSTAQDFARFAGRRWRNPHQ